MIRALAPAIAVVLLVACGKGSPRDQLIGTWTFDAETFKTMDEYKNASDAERQMMDGMLGAMKMEVEFTATKTRMSMEMMGQTKTEEGEYKVVKEEGDTLTLEATDKNGKTQRVTVVVDDDKLIFTEGKQTFALKRK